MPLSQPLSQRKPALRYVEDFLDHDIAGELFEGCMMADWQTESFKIFGRTTPAPRRLAWFGDGGLNYRYTGIDHIADGWPDFLASVRRDIERLAGESFNFVLLNRYDDGRHYMGWHRDNEAGCTGRIASLSLGGQRKFRIDVDDKISEISLGHGSLLVFNGEHRHMLSKTAGNVATRINLTFRQLLV